MVDSDLTKVGCQFSKKEDLTRLDCAEMSTPLEIYEQVAVLVRYSHRAEIEGKKEQFNQITKNYIEIKNTEIQIHLFQLMTAFGLQQKEPVPPVSRMESLKQAFYSKLSDLAIEDHVLVDGLPEEPKVVQLESKTSPSAIGKLNEINSILENAEMAQ